ncbi:MAG: hypothetical protein GVY16_03960 [Planctomycetes bacterium]|jgi:hypothetical protein|nr:hypothetical protein [Phycisphaerae bacterium]NBB94876.1 hypothetical protein [Planctomycetota bacterium]
MAEPNESRRRRICRFLGLAKPRTRLGRVLRWIEAIVIGLGVIYLLALAFPEPLFQNRLQIDGIELHSTAEIPAESADLLRRTRDRVRRSELYRDDLQFDIFICNSDWLFTVLAPRGRDGFGACFPVTDNIFLASVDLRSNVSRAYRQHLSDRPFVAVAAHEITHVLLRKHVGFWGEQAAPTWLKEGYCEMIAGQPSFPPPMGDYLLARGRRGGAASFVYFMYLRMVEYLIEVEGRSIRDLLADPPAREEVLAKVQAWSLQRLQHCAR